MVDAYMVLVSVYLVSALPQHTKDDVWAETTTTKELLETTTEPPWFDTEPPEPNTRIYKVQKKVRIGPGPTGPPSRWVSAALRAPLVPDSGPPLCRAHSQLYRHALDNLTLWAVQMADASAGWPVGVLPGQTAQLGHFDSCISASAPGLGVEGRYCLADVRFAPLSHPRFTQPHPQSKFRPPHSTLPVWERIKNNSDLSHRSRDLLRWAVCVPASCDPSSVGASLARALARSGAPARLSFDVHLPPRRCYAPADEPPLSAGFYAVIGVFSLAAAVALAATAMDFFIYQADRPHNRTIRRWLRPFSMHKNMAKLTRPNEDREFAELHVYKLIAMMFVVAGHRQMYAIGQTPLHDTSWVEQMNAQFMDVVILNGGVVVDTFFVLSGFLTCHHILRELHIHKRFNFVVVLVNRWIRLAPVYMAVVAFFALVLPRLGDGPLWSERLHTESSRCRDNWWTNLLFINNYVHADRQCLVQSWYLACDMHYFLVGSLLVYLLWRWPRLGLAALSTATITSLVVPAVITYRNSYYGAVLHYMSLMADPQAVQHYRHMYIPSHVRAGPYLVGISTALIYTRLKAASFRFSQKWLVLGSTAAGGLLWGSVLLGWLCYDRARPYYRWENTLYAALHRSVWAVGVAWFVVAEGTTGLGTVTKVMKHGVFTVFGRLTYCAMLVHTVPQIYLTASARVPEHLTIPKLFWVITGDGASAYILALFLNLLFEAPTERLQKKAIKRLMHKNGKSGENQGSTVGLQLTNGLTVENKPNNGFKNLTNGINGVDNQAMVGDDSANGHIRTQTKYENSV